MTRGMLQVSCLTNRFFSVGVLLWTTVSVRPWSVRIGPYAHSYISLLLLVNIFSKSSKVLNICFLFPLLKLYFGAMVLCQGCGSVHPEKGLDPDRTVNKYRFELFEIPDSSKTSRSSQIRLRSPVCIHPSGSSWRSMKIRVRTGLLYSDLSKPDP